MQNQLEDERVKMTVKFYKLSCLSNGSMLFKVDFFLVFPFLKKVGPARDDF